MATKRAAAKVIDYDLSGDDQKRLVALRGGCTCHLAPPCSQCCEPITDAEAERLGLVPVAEDAPKQETWRDRPPLL